MAKATRGEIEVTLFMSITVNGMVGRPDGRGDFFTDVNWTNFVAHAKAKGAMVWGRKTHDDIKAWPRDALKDLEGVDLVVLTSNAGYQPGRGWGVAASPMAALDQLVARGHRRVLVVGGAKVNRAFFVERLVDEVVLDLEAIILGRGMPLLEPADLELRLDLLGVERLTDTVLELRYRVRGR